MGEGRGGPGAGPRALFARAPACVRRTLQRPAFQAYLGLLFRHGCAAAAAAGSTARTSGTGAGESRSLPRRSPAATVAGPRFIPKSWRAGWPRSVTWRRACTMRVPCASGARWPAAIPDGCDCVTGRVRHPGARRAPGTRDSRSWVRRPLIWVQACGATQGARTGRRGRTGGVCARTGAKETLRPNRTWCLQATTLPPTFGHFSCMQAAFWGREGKKMRAFRLTPSVVQEDQ